MPFSRNSFYRKILLGLLSFCVIPALVVFILTYYVYSRNIIEKYASHELERLNRIALSNSLIFREMRETFQDIPTSLDLGYFSKHTFSDDITRFYSFNEVIRTRLMNARYLHSVTLYSQSFGYLWTTASSEAEEEFSRDTEYLHGYGESQYYNRFFYRENPVTGKGMISYIYPSFQNGTRGEILFIINVYADVLAKNTAELSDRFHKKISFEINGKTLPLDGYESFYETPLIRKLETDKNGWDIETKGRKQTIISVVREDDSSMIYYSLVEMKEYTSDFQGFFLVVFALFCIFLLVALFLAVYYTGYLYSPMDELIHSLSPADENSRVDEFQLIMSKYTGILESNQNLRGLLDANELIMRDRFLENLFKGHYDSNESISSGMKRFKINLSPQCLVINCYVENRQEIMKYDWSRWLGIKHRLQILAEETLREYDNIQGLTSEFSGEEVIIILSFPMEDEKEITAIGENFLADFMERCYPVMDEKIHLGVGGLSHNISDYDVSYGQSVMALRLGLLPGDQRVHHYQQEILVNRTGRLGESFLNRFIGLAKSPDLTSLDDYLNKTMEEIGNGLSPRSSFAYVIRIVSRIMEYIESHYGIFPESYLKESPYLMIIQCQTMEEVKAELRIFLKSSITALKEKQDEAGASGKKVKLAEEYINNNYSDVSLNLTRVADKAGLNPSYLSRIFSQERGQAFQDFLSEVRLREAKALMRSTNLPLYKISGEVGFGSVLSFNRTFKKREGCTPKEYKDSHS